MWASGSLRVGAGLLALAMLAGDAASDPGVRAGDAQDGADGAALFRRYCASCHGVGADGNGSVAPTLRTPPADLRQLWRRYGTPLAVEQVTQFVDGRRRVLAHGESDMPVWGRRLKQTGDAQDEIEIRDTLRAIIVYLDSIQAAPPGTTRPRDDRSRPGSQ